MPRRARDASRGDALIFNTINMPNSDIWTTSEQIGFAAGGILKTGLTDITFQLVNNVSLQSIKGKDKWSNPNLFNSFQNFFVKTRVNSQGLPANYQYFGTLGNYERYFSELLRTNPFFVSALTATANGFELNFTNLANTNTWTSRIVNNLDPMYIRYNVAVNPDFSIGAITAFRKNADGSYAPCPNLPTGFALPAGVTEREYTILGALFLMIYYVEVVHATLHVYHYVMCAGMEDSTRDDSNLSYWCAQYDDGVWLKYQEVQGVLFAPAGSLTGTATAGGFIANQKDVIAISTQLFVYWCSINEGQDFIHSFILGGVGGVYPNNCLTQYAAEAADINDFAKDLCSAFATLGSNGATLNGATANLKLFFGGMYNQATNDTPFSFQNQKDAFRRWITLMSATGILHAGTFSFSRAFITQPIMAFLRPNSTTFTGIDVALIALVTGTIIGISDGRHTYTDGSVGFFTQKQVSGILKYYNSKAETRRKAYFFNISQNPDFAKLGWIWTDYCEDTIDNKQVTIATYV